MAEHNTVKDTEEKLAEAENAPAKSRVPLMVAAAIVLVGGGLIAGAAYLGVSASRVKIDKAAVSAPTVELSPTVAGTLMQVYVSPGDVIPPNTIVAEVGTELIKSTAGGLVIDADTDIGSAVAAGAPVVATIDPGQLRVVGQLDENKGLTRIKAGDRAVFTVDAFGGREFTGVVDEVSPTAHAGDVVFSISDKRQTQSFDVKVAFDRTAYPELKNGMSARIWIYTK
jgi:multidrug resistance efflux pump